MPGQRRGSKMSRRKRSFRREMHLRRSRQVPRRVTRGALRSKVARGCARSGISPAAGAAKRLATRGAKPAARTRKALDFFTLDAAENVVLKHLGSAEESVLRLCHCSTRCQSQLNQLQRTNKIGKLKQTIPLRFYRLSKFDSLPSHKGMAM